jgi:hypothetical protein
MREGGVTVTVPRPDGKPGSIHMIAPGDTIDLGAGGLLVFFREPLATAVRTFQEESARGVRESIAFAEGRVARLAGVLAGEAVEGMIGRSLASDAGRLATA